MSLYEALSLTLNFLGWITTFVLTLVITVLLTDKK